MTQRRQRPPRAAAHQKPRIGRRRVPGNRIQVEVSNLQRLPPRRVRKLKSIVRAALKSEGVTAAHVELAIVDDQRIRQLHKRFLNVDTSTDVLTFPFHTSGEPLCGEVVISAETAARVGARHGLSPEEELFLYAIHGILHLCGYDDRTTRERNRMHRRQNLLFRDVVVQAPRLPRRSIVG